GTGFGLVDCNNNCRNRDGSLAPNGLYGGVVQGSIAASNDAGEREFARGDFFRVGSRNALPEPLLVPPAFLKDVVANRRSSGTPAQPSASTGLGGTGGSGGGSGATTDGGSNASSGSAGTGGTTSGSGDAAAQITGLTAPTDPAASTTGSSTTTSSTATSYQQTSELNAAGQPAALDTGNTIVHSIAGIKQDAANTYSSDNETSQSTITGTLVDLFTAFSNDPNKACEMISNCTMDSANTLVEGGKVKLTTGENVYWGVLKEANGAPTGHHFAYGVPTAVQPSSGIVTFSHAGGSTPRDTLAGFNASGGTWQQGSLIVDFGARTLSTGDSWKWSLGSVYTRTYQLDFSNVSYASGASTIQVVGTGDYANSGSTGTLSVYTSGGTSPSIGSTGAWISPSFIGTNAAAVAVGVTTLHKETSGTSIQQTGSSSNQTVGTASVQVFTRPR
ncbi:MAG: hypothetical protein RIR00_924, partial [Pseudomonadota bacterium]